MASVHVRSYVSPTLVLLALDWKPAAHQVFLGFAVQRTPGFRDFKTGAQEATSWLPNRIGFDGPPPKESGLSDYPSNVAPIQKFMWWDARIDDADRGKSLRYEVWPVIGAPGALQLIDADKEEITISLPNVVEHGIGTWFNRAVVSSQAFSKLLVANGIEDTSVAPPAAVALKLRKWLGNGMESAVPEFLKTTKSVVGAIYHLTDDLFIIPAFDNLLAKQQRVELVYDSHEINVGKGKPKKPSPNQPAVDALGPKGLVFFERDKTNIMHNKFLVSGTSLDTDDEADARSVTCGSANYTTEGLTTQANLIHTFDSPDLAHLYLARFKLLRDNPTVGDTAANAKWSNMVTVGDAGVRVFFPPEKQPPKKELKTAHKLAMDPIIDAIHSARRSVLFCLFMPTDRELRDACFAAGDNGKMMFGLVNNITQPKEEDQDADAGELAADKLANLELFHRSRGKKDVIDARYFTVDNLPEGFEPEIRLFPGERPPGKYAPVIIHHKLVIIDAETSTPTIYVGSANMSGNSVWHNDENLLEIKGSVRLAGIYLAEFMRLYEHYRARAHAIKHAKGEEKLALRHTAAWCKPHFTRGTPEYRARESMAKEP